MSMSMSVVGFLPPDEQWLKMKAAYDACKAIGVEPPEEVEDFFNGEDPGDAPGKEVQLEGNGAKEWRSDGSEGFEVELARLPKSVKFVRFYCSW